MKKRHHQTVFFRVGIVAYLAATLLLPQGFVYCQATDGHTAIELAHGSCPEASHADRSDGKSLHALLDSQEACTDTSLMLPAIINRTRLGDSISLLSSPTKVACVWAYATSADSYSNLHWAVHNSPPSFASPAIVLSTTVLLI